MPQPGPILIQPGRSSAAAIMTRPKRPGAAPDDVSGPEHCAVGRFGALSGYISTRIGQRKKRTNSLKPKRRPEWAELLSVMPDLPSQTDSVYNLRPVFRQMKMENQ